MIDVMAGEEIIKVKDLPEVLFEAIHRDIRDFTVAFIDHRDNDPTSSPRLLGSGVLVSVGGVKAILTAAHVLDVLPKDRRLCVLLEKTNHPHSIDSSATTFVSIARGKKDNEGPDLGALILAPTVASSIAAKRLFYDLDTHRHQALDSPRDLDDGLWMTQGYVAERTVVTPDPDGRGGTTGFYQFGGAGGPDQIIVRDPYDYFEFPISVDARDVPKDWGGMSGGGVWQIRLKREGEAIVGQRPLLSGIMFYQAKESARAISIRSHGRRSVYDAAYRAIAGQ